MRKLLFCLLLLLTGSVAAQGEAGIRPEQVAVVVNESDAASVEVGSYYLQARGIPAQNLVRVNIPGSPRKLSSQAFELMRQQIESHLPPDIQVIVLAWTAPYMVECNSITAALTLGYDAAQCRETCAPGKPSPYFNSAARRPSDFGLRLAMLLPAQNVSQARALIDRGVISGFRVPAATAYYVTTSDPDRNPRARFFPREGSVPQLQLTVKNLKGSGLEAAEDILVYQIGTIQVPHLDKLGFVPGALADHLTSAGGDLLGATQMSALRWLEAGATASYGTVSEPCNYWQKFPHPSVLLRHYLSGATAVEAYWKSVAWPAQGLFIGEPLAAPYASKR